MSRQRADLPGEEVRPLSALAAELPYPLGMKLRALLQGHRRRIEGEPEPQLAFELCAVMGVLIRFVSFIAIRGYVDAGGTDARLNHLIVSRLRAPTDGGWLEVGQRLAKALDGAEAAPLIRLLASAFKERPALPPAVRQQARGATGPGKALSGLVRFRNALVHGEPQTEADLARALALLEVAVRGFAGLSRYRLQVRHAGRTWWLTGAVPRPGPDRPDLPPNEPCLVAIDADDPPMSLSPLLRFRAGEGDDALDLAFDELLFLNAGSAERLSYIGYRTAGQVDGRQLGSYDAFKSFVSRIPTPPIPSEPRIDFSALGAFHSRLFVGRGAVLREVAGIVAAPPTGYAVIEARAGMGKSAIFGVLLQSVINRDLPEGERVSSAADGLIRAGDRWVFHFCMPTDGRASPTVALRSLIAQICDQVGWDRKPWLTARRSASCWSTTGTGTGCSTTGSGGSWWARRGPRCSEPDRTRGAPTPRAA